MSKKYITIRKWMYIAFYVTILIFVFNLKTFSEFNFYGKITSAPFLLIFKSFNTFLSFEASYFVSIIILSLVFMPVFSGLLGLVRKYVEASKVIISIRKRTDLESTVKANMMLDYLDSSSVSFTSLVLTFLSTYLFGYGISTLTYGIFNSSIIEPVNFAFLWFKIAENNVLFSSITYCLFLISTLFTLKNALKNKNYISIVVSLMLCISLISVLFAPASVVLFVLINIVINELKKVIYRILKFKKGE